MDRTSKRSFLSSGGREPACLDRAPAARRGLGAALRAPELTATGVCDVPDAATAAALWLQGRQGWGIEQTRVGDGSLAASRCGGSASEWFGEGEAKSKADGCVAARVARRRLGWLSVAKNAETGVCFATRAATEAALGLWGRQGWKTKERK